MYKLPFTLPRLSNLTRLAPLGVALCLFALSARGQAPVSLMQAGQDTLGWGFDNGREFAGATGQLAIDPAQKHDTQDSLKLVADFSKGGAYVRAGTSTSTDIGDLSMWLKCPDTDHIVIRIIDSTGQCHQITFNVPQKDDWQKFDFPLQKYFAKTEAAGGTAVAKYEGWGGANDQKWHGPAKSIDIVVNSVAPKKVINLWISGVSVTPPTAAGS